MPKKLYRPERGKLWVEIAKRYVAIAERELYDIYPKTIGLKHNKVGYPYTLEATALIQPLGGHAWELSYKALATSHLKPIDLQHKILEIHKELPDDIQSEIETIYIDCMKSENNHETRDYVYDLSVFLEKHFLDPYIRYGATEYEPIHISGNKTKPERERYEYSSIEIMRQYMRFIKEVVNIADREVTLKLGKKLSVAKRLN